LLPTSRLALAQSLPVEQFADASPGDLELGGEVGQILVELGGERHELRAVVFQERAHGAEAMRALRCAGLQFRRG
jgi:hypothetical protein